MIIPVYISEDEIERLCYVDDDGFMECDGYEYDHEYTVDQVEFDRADLEDIVDEYFDDIIDIILGDNRLRRALFRKLRNDVNALLDAIVNIRGEKK
jgi:hypothetical protein